MVNSQLSMPLEKGGRASARSIKALFPLSLTCIVFREPIGLLNAVWLVRLLLVTTVSRYLAGSEGWKGRRRAVLVGGTQSLMKCPLHDLRDKTGQRNITGTQAVSAQPQGLASFSPMTARVEPPQPPAAHGSVQNGFLFKDDGHRVPLGLSEVLGWGSLVGIRMVPRWAAGTHWRQIQENEICNFALIAR